MRRKLHSNRDIADALSEIGELLAAQGVAFKPRAYERAAELIRNLPQDLGELYRKGGIRAILGIPGIGASLAEKIEEAVTKGTISYLEELRRELPVDIASLVRVQGLGPKSIVKLYRALGIRTIADLERAAEKGEIRKLEGFGAKKEQEILRAIRFLRQGAGRHILGFVQEEANQIVQYLQKVLGPRAIVTLAGSARRKRETVGDFDILAALPPLPPKKSEQLARTAMDAFVAMPNVAYVTAHGTTKSSVRLTSGIDVDLRIVPRESYGAALHYFTGSKAHNIALREIAIQQGMKLNEYGLFRVRGKREVKIAGSSEEEIYAALGLDVIPPELREDCGEIEAARQHTLPSLIPYGSLQGDLQVQTNWSDGKASIEEMAREAARYGLRYIAITDHTKRLAMTHGLDARRIQKQWLEIDRVNKKLRRQGVPVTVLKGTECDILKDGSLDLPDHILAKLDVVGISVHSHFRLSKKEQTARVLRAMENPHVHILFHPTTRIIHRREPIEIDMEAVLVQAKKKKVILEIDAFPDRSDLADVWIRRCREEGVPMVIDSDAHDPSHFAYLEYGIAQARRGWAERRHILNTLPLAKLLARLRPTS
ncbi:DNA polymerase/3'-5' exonuclease PolX [Candidatus Parcubacteria bacterium]|nr:MAG: DNA polymerase/3'-5' exonuclease PolX [Candidatus Parcubacteria bacterium]